MNNLLIRTAIAHSGEDHETKVEATTHYFDFLLNPYVAIVMLFVILTIIYFLLSKFKVKFSSIILSLLIIDFALGIIGLIFVLPMGIVALSIGFAASIFIVLVGVSS